MTTNFTKIWLLLLSATISGGALYTLAQQITIPIWPAKHESTLVDLRLGEQNNDQIIRLGTNKEVIIPGGLIVGEVNTNTISSPGILATIAGGSDNHIQGTSNNSTIGAGESNNINGATNSTIGAGRTNEIKQNVESSFVGGGDANIISASFSSIVGGKNNTISSPRSIIPGGTNNTINAGADYSFVAGQRGVVNNEGTFIWSDYSESYEYTQPWMNYDWNIQSTTWNTFLIRALNGMSINTHSAIAGVNVNIAGATQIGKENKLAQNCAGATGALLSGTYEQQDGCLYYCDGNHRQLLNTDTPGNAQRCGEQSPYSGNIAYTKCTLYGDIKKPYTMSFRAGESIYAYSVPSDPNCANKKRLLTCQRNGKWDNENYKYLHCTKTN